MLSIPTVFFRNLKYGFLLSFAVAIVLSCNNEDDMNAQDALSITFTSTTFMGASGSDIDIPIKVKAESGVEKLTVTIDGATSQDLPITVGAIEEDISLVFTIPATTPAGTEFELEFVLTDRDNTSVSETVNVLTE